MKLAVWLVAGMMVLSGCAAAYESEPVAPASPASTEVRSAASPSQPGCQEQTHQAFPEAGSFVAVDELPEAITKVPPEYPAGTHGDVDGSVLVRALVCEHGRVVKAVVVKSEALLLNESCTEAAKQWTFRPAQRDGRAIATWIDLPFSFKLR